MNFKYSILLYIVVFLIAYWIEGLLGIDTNDIKCSVINILIAIGIEMFIEGKIRAKKKKY